MMATRPRTETRELDGDGLADGYQMLEELGSGSFGIVYKAIEKSTGQIVAIKHVDLESSEEDISDIQAEIAVLSSCASPFVTQYKTAFLRGQKLWIVMEYLGGGSCQDLLKPGPFSESHIAIICQQLLLGLAYLHSEGKLHRDIKAANVLLSQSGKVKLADFGVAAQLTNIKSLRNTFVGTPFWMAPEVIQQAGHDFKADIWSLGITAMELIHGEPPHAATHPMKVLFLIPKAPAPRLEGNRYSRDFRDFVASCLIKDPDRRPSAKDLLKHRFIRNAGKVESLQELIIRRQEWEVGRGMERNLKYYAETLRSLPKPDQSGADEWVFDTVKTPAPAAMQTMKMNTKRRKVEGERMEIDSDADVDLGRARDVANAMEDLSLEPDRTSNQGREVLSTMRRSSVRHVPPQSSSAKRSTPKRMSSGQQHKQPLGVNLSFGNSPSTVRQFRRVSPNVENTNPLGPPALKAHSNSTNASKQSQPVDSDTHSMPPPPRPSPPSSNFSSTATTINTPEPEPESKELFLGKRIYANAVGLACQDVLNETANEGKREAVSKLAEAWSDLESMDPEGVYHIMKGVLERMRTDEKLGQMVGAEQPSTAESQASTLHETSQSKANAAKLVLAQNNPHLKSHRRRQSVQITKTASGDTWSPPGAEKEKDKEILKAMPGQGGLDHTRALADVLFERWCEGLRNRWPAV